MFALVVRPFLAADTLEQQILEINYMVYLEPFMFGANIGVFREPFVDMSRNIQPDKRLRPPQTSQRFGFNRPCEIGVVKLKQLKRQQVSIPQNECF